jgi:hypothetical protein
MPRSARLLFILAAVVALNGCTGTTLPYENAPGYSYSDGDPHSTCIRESDNCYVHSIDGEKIRRDTGLGDAGGPIYRQFLMAPGHHVVKAFYHQPQSSMGAGLTISIDLDKHHTVKVPFDGRSDHLYLLRCNPGFIRITTLPISWNNWKPQLVDQSPAQPANPQATVKDTEASVK